MHTRAFTLVDTCALLVCVGMGVALMAVGIGQPEPAHAPMPKVAEPGKRGANDPETIISAKTAKAAAAQLKDSTQVRGIHQGMVMFGQNNHDCYPLPSEFDKSGATIKGDASEKNTTSNIVSVMIWNGFFGPELCVSPAESSDKIKVCESYAYTNPQKAANPAQAQWDPAFSADFSDGNTGNFSYAHALPNKSRLDIAWKNTFNATTPSIGNRGPKVVDVKPLEGDAVEPEFAGKSKTNLIHGGPDTWEGNVAFNDNHVNYMTKMYEPKITYTDAKGIKRPDVFFYNEPEDETDTNHVLGIFTRSGNTTKAFKAIWD